MPATATVDSAELIRLHSQGLGYGAIAGRLGCDKTTARYWCHKLNLGRQPRAADVAECRAVELGYTDLAAALQALAPTHTVQDLADLFDAKYQTMYWWLRRRGIRALVLSPFQPAVDPMQLEGGTQEPLPMLEPEREALPTCLTTQERWLQRIETIMPPEPQPDCRPVVLRTGERWCKRCGEEPWDDQCPRCGCTEFVDPCEVLRPEEWVLQ